MPSAPSRVRATSTSEAELPEGPRRRCSPRTVIARWEGVIFARNFLAAVLVAPQVKPLLSNEHFSVDGTLIEAWAREHSRMRQYGLSSRSTLYTGEAIHRK